MTQNVINYQFIKYVEARGIDPHTLTTNQRQELKSEMVKDLYPGAYTLAYLRYYVLLRLIFEQFQGWTNHQRLSKTQCPHPM